jgi:hypothetical protein
MHTYNDLSHKVHLIILGVYEPLEMSYRDSTLGRDPGFDNPSVKRLRSLPHANFK